MPLPFLVFLLALLSVVRGSAAASPCGSSQGNRDDGDDFQPPGLLQHQTYPRLDVALLAHFPCKKALLNKALKRTAAADGAHSPPGVPVPAHGAGRHVDTALGRFLSQQRGTDAGAVPVLTSAETVAHVKAVRAPVVPSFPAFGVS